MVAEHAGLADPRGRVDATARAVIESAADAIVAFGTDRTVLLCTDLHAGNVLSSQREPWLVIDPKPFMGDPAFDPAQHMLNCDERMATDPKGLSLRLAALLELEVERVKLWLFARCAQESLHDLTMRVPAVRLAP